MGLASGRVSFRRYRIDGPFPKEIDKALVKRLQRYAFESSRTGSADGVEDRIRAEAGRNPRHRALDLVAGRVAGGRRAQLEGEPELVEGYVDAHNGGCGSPEFGNPFQQINEPEFCGTACHSVIRALRRFDTSAAHRDTPDHIQPT